MSDDTKEMSRTKFEEGLPLYDELLEKAQKRFDEIRVRNKERLSRLSNKSSTSIDTNGNSVNQVFSSLLYLSLMIHRVDAMKELLKAHGNESFQEWDGLFCFLRSPKLQWKVDNLNKTHLERLHHRKRFYKSAYEKCNKENSSFKETFERMSKVISELNEENRSVKEQLSSFIAIEADDSMLREELEAVQQENERQKVENNKLDTERRASLDQLNNVQRLFDESTQTAQRREKMLDDCLQEKNLIIIEKESIVNQLNCSYSEVESLKSRTNVYEDQNNRLSDEIKSLNKSMQSLEVEKAHSSQYIQHLEYSLSTLQSEKQQMKSEMVALTSRTEDCEKENTRLLAEIHSLNQDLVFLQNHKAHHLQSIQELQDICTVLQAEKHEVQSKAVIQENRINTCEEENKRLSEEVNSLNILLRSLEDEKTRDMQCIQELQNSCSVLQSAKSLMGDDMANLREKESLLTQNESVFRNNISRLKSTVEKYEDELRLLKEYDQNVKLYMDSIIMQVEELLINSRKQNLSKTDSIESSIDDGWKMMAQKLLKIAASYSKETETMINFPNDVSYGSQNGLKLDIEEDNLPSQSKTETLILSEDHSEANVLSTTAQWAEHFVDDYITEAMNKVLRS